MKVTANGISVSYTLDGPAGAPVGPYSLEQLDPGRRGRPGESGSGRNGRVRARR